MTRHAAAWVAGAALALAAPGARADDFSVDVGAPARAGFAWQGITRGPAFSLSFGADFDVLPITKHLAFTLVGDIEASARPDLPADDPRSSFGGFGAGAGLFYLTDGLVGFGLESVAWTTFDNQDIVGGGFSTRAYVIPFYLPLDTAVKRFGDPMAAWVRSSIAIWVSGRVDWTSDGNGGSLAFGMSLDVTRIFLLPYVEAMQKVLR